MEIDLVSNAMNGDNKTIAAVVFCICMTILGCTWIVTRAGLERDALQAQQSHAIAAERS